MIAGWFHKLIKYDTDTQARQDDVLKVVFCDISSNWGTFRRDIWKRPEPTAFARNGAKFKKKKKNGALYPKTQGSPDSDAGIPGDAAAHHSLGAFDDALVLWRFGDAGARCGHRQDGICTPRSLKCSESRVYPRWAAHFAMLI